MFEAVATITEDESRADALCAVIVRLGDRPGDQDRLTIAMAQARTIPSVSDRARVLNALTSRTTDMSLWADALASQLPTPGYASWVIRNVFRQTAHRRRGELQERLDLLRRVYHAPLTTSQLIGAIAASAELIAAFGNPALATHIELVWNAPDLPTSRRSRHRSGPTCRS